MAGSVTQATARWPSHCCPPSWPRRHPHAALALAGAKIQADPGYGSRVDPGSGSRMGGPALQASSREGPPQGQLQPSASAAAGSAGAAAVAAGGGVTAAATPSQASSSSVGSMFGSLLKLSRYSQKPQSTGALQPAQAQALQPAVGDSSNEGGNGDGPVGPPQPADAPFHRASSDPPLCHWPPAAPQTSPPCSPRLSPPQLLSPRFRCRPLPPQMQRLRHMPLPLPLSHLLFLPPLPAAPAPALALALTTLSVCLGLCECHSPLEASCTTCAAVATSDTW